MRTDRERSSSPLNNWEEWGMGPKGKGKGIASRPTNPHGNQPSQRTGRGNQTDGPPLGERPRSEPIDRGKGEPRGKGRGKATRPSNLHDNHPSRGMGRDNRAGGSGPDGGEGGGGPDGGGGWGGGASSPTGPILMNPDDNHAPAALFSTLQPYTGRRLTDQDWANWCSLLDHWTQGFSQWSYTRSKQSHPTPQAAWAQWQQNRRQQPNADLPRNPTRNRTITRMVALQKAYRQHPKRCMAMLRKTPPPTRCNIPIATVTDFFLTKQRAADTGTSIGPPPTQMWQDASPTDLLETPITSNEIQDTLKRTNSNSAPGPDHLSYTVWKKLDPKYDIITAILNTCRVNIKIPPSWKGSNTILIYKGNDTNNLDNWRPIALQNTLYKVYASIIARRMSNWATTNEILSNSQKGFLPVEGCFEHGFVLKSILQDSRRNRKAACVAWLDLKDAFGSVPHHVLFETLRLTGLRGATLAVIQDIYSGASTSVRTASTTSDPIPCRRGVKQGCPLSPILFDLVIEVVIRAMEEVPRAGYQIAHTNIKTLTYADDLCAFASSPSIIQQMLARAQEAAAWAGLTFNPRKCAALTMVRGGGIRQRVDRPQLKIAGELIPTLPWEASTNTLAANREQTPNLT